MPSKRATLFLGSTASFEEYEATRRRAILDNAGHLQDSTEALFKSTHSVSKDELEKVELNVHIAQADYGAAVEQVARRELTAPFDGVITDLLLHLGASCEPNQPAARIVNTTRCYFIGYVDGKVVPGLHLDQDVSIELVGTSRHCRETLLYFADCRPRERACPCESDF